MTAERTTRVRNVALLRAGWGLLLVSAPAAVLRAGGHREPSRAAWAVRVLGARHLVQAAVTVAAPSRPVVTMGAVLDGLHASSVVALAAASSRWRRTALADALVETTLAGSPWIVDHHRPARGQQRQETQ
jgi:hypothetical protein